MEHVEGDPQSAEVADRVDLGLMQLSCRNNFASLGVNALAGLGIAFILSKTNVSAMAIGLWVGMLALHTLVRLAGTIQAREAFADARWMEAAERRRWKTRYAAELYSGLCLWTVMTWMAMTSDSETARFSVLITVAALAAGATGILAAQLAIGRVYLVFMMLQGAVQLFISPEPHYVLGLLGFVFTAVMTMTHRNNHMVLRRSLILQFENESLVETLESERNALEELNATLETRVNLRTAELKQLAERDPLTRLFNRSGILRWLDEQNGSPDGNDRIAVIFLDLDRFKQINDSMGHTIGDCVLTEIAYRLRAVIPASAALCRWGGDEFIALLPARQEEAEEAAKALAALMRKAVERTITVSSYDLHVGFSAGIAITTMNPVSVSEAIRTADIAVGEAKKSGRGITRVYTGEMVADYERKLLIAQALGNAVYANEFHLAFQPIVAVQTGRIDSYEVLLRWISPVLGYVNPEEFIPVAEDIGKIVEIGNFVLDKALGEFALATATRKEVKVAINVSIRQLIVPGFADTVRSLLAQHAVRPQRLILEVTESIFDDRNRATIRGVLDDLQHDGIHIHVDDFGTGYSSLSRLHEIPIDALKIDKSFVLNPDDQARAIIEGSVFIARKLGIHTIAEGVETEEQARRLRDMGVDCLQGYLFGRPAAFPLPELPVPVPSGLAPARATKA